MFGHSQGDKSATVFCCCTESPRAMLEKCFFLIFRPESVYATKCILVNTDSTLLLCSWEGRGSNLFGCSCRPPVEKVKLGRDPTVLCINAFCIVVWLFPPLSMYLFQLGRSGAHFEAFCPFKASDDWKDSKIWKAVKTPQLPRSDSHTKGLKAAEAEVVFLQIWVIWWPSTLQIFPPICVASPCEDLS